MNRHARFAILALLAQAIFCLPALAADRGMAVTYKAPAGGRGGLTGTVRLYDHSYAVVIGIDAYRGSLPALTGAVRDAVTVTAALKAQGFGVTTLLDGQATRKGITEVLGDVLPNRLGPGDRVLVYFAGHGVSTGSGDTAIGYLVPVDGDRERLRSTGISMAELTSWFADYRCKHVMFVADACYSGLALSTRAAGLPVSMPDYLLQITRKPVRMIMTAGGAGQSAHEWRGQGLFTRFFLDAIGGAADADRDGIVTSDEVAAWVKPNVARTAMTYMRAEQTPLVGREGEGEFVFVTGTPAGKAPAPESAPVATPPAETAERGPVDPATLPAKPGMLERFKGYFARKPAEPAPPAEITGPHGAPMVLVPAGKFKMGSAIGVYTPVHKVTISRAFYLDKYEVSFARYDRFCEATGRPTPEDAGWGRGNQPVMNVTSVDADAYVRHYGMRLPTEAEWEYAARAGSAGRWSWGDDEKRVDEFIWYGANSGGRAHPVGTKSPNAWGLFDMEGNVAEWVSDWYANDYDKTRPARDPEGPPGPRSRRMHRGGSWHEEEPPGVATGGGDEPELRLQVLGFRCALPVR